MKVSEAINVLQNLLNEHGDVSFVCLDADEGNLYHYSPKDFTYDTKTNYVICSISYWINESAE